MFLKYWVDYFFLLIFAEFGYLAIFLFYFLFFDLYSSNFAGIPEFLVKIN